MAITKFEDTLQYLDRKHQLSQQGPWNSEQEALQEAFPNGVVKDLVTQVAQRPRLRRLNFSGEELGVNQDAFSGYVESNNDQTVIIFNDAEGEGRWNRTLRVRTQNGQTRLSEASAIQGDPNRPLQVDWDSRQICVSDHGDFGFNLTDNRHVQRYVQVDQARRVSRLGDDFDLIISVPRNDSTDRRILTVGVEESSTLLGEGIVTAALGIDGNKVTVQYSLSQGDSAVSIQHDRQLELLEAARLISRFTHLSPGDIHNPDAIAAVAQSFLGLTGELSTIEEITAEVNRLRTEIKGQLTTRKQSSPRLTGGFSGLLRSR